MADAVHVPPEKRLLNTSFKCFAVSASVRIQGGFLSYGKSVFVLQKFHQNIAAMGPRKAFLAENLCS
jgi:hypothetical protein